VSCPRPGADVVVVGSAANLGATDRSAVVAITDVESYTLVRSDDRWTVLRGTGDDPTGPLTVPAATATPVLSRALVVDGVAGVFTVDRDSALDERALDGVAHFGRSPGVMIGQASTIVRLVSARRRRTGSPRRSSDPRRRAG
jgi:hypothetical protein